MRPPDTLSSGYFCEKIDQPHLKSDPRDRGISSKLRRKNRRPETTVDGEKTSNVRAYTPDDFRALSAQVAVGVLKVNIG